MCDLDSSLVMAEQRVHDVVNQTMSDGDYSPSDAYEHNSTLRSNGGDNAAVGEMTDLYKEERSDQDIQCFDTGSENHPLVNGQAHVCSAIHFTGLVLPDSVLEQNEPIRFQTTPADTFTQTDSNLQDSDFDGNISGNQSVGDLSAASDTDTRKIEQLSASEDIKAQDASNASRRPASFKPVSFAKYSAAKVAGINSAAKSTADRGESSDYPTGYY
jgi:hypothetical protein